MSDKRTSQSVQQEHWNLALKAGNIGYQVKELEKELTMVYSAMRDLSLEFVKLKAEETAASSPEVANASQS